MIWVLFFINVIFLIINFLHSQKNIFTPGVLFTFAFTLSSFFCPFFLLMNSNKSHKIFVLIKMRY